MEKIIKIGNCAACQCRCRLVDELCTKCHTTLSEMGWKTEFGLIMRKCREDKLFARIVYSKLKQKVAMDVFSEWFGPFSDESKSSVLKLVK